MNPEDLPLRDIHLPPPVSWWPPAPGWWLLLAILVVLAGVWLWWWQQPLRRMQRTALRALEATARQWRAQRDDRVLLRELSALLRRFLIAARGRAAVASLNGDAWLDTLNDGLPDRPFDREPGRLLRDAHYRADIPALDLAWGDALVAMCRERIRSAA